MAIILHASLSIPANFGGGGHFRGIVHGVEMKQTVSPISDIHEIAKKRSQDSPSGAGISADDMRMFGVLDLKTQMNGWHSLSNLSSITDKYDVDHRSKVADLLI